MNREMEKVENSETEQIAYKNIVYDKSSIPK